MSHWSVKPGLSTTAEAALLTALFNLADSGSSQAIRKVGGSFFNVDIGGGSVTLTIGSTTIASGTTTRILYDNAGVLGEYTITGTGTVVAMAISPTFVTSIITPLTDFGGNGTIIGTSRGLRIQTPTGGSAGFLQFAGTSSSFPAIKQSSNTLAFRLADDSGDAGITAASAVFSTTLQVTGHTTFEGVTSTGATGTGKLVYDGSPTLTTAALGSSTATTQSQLDGSTKVATTSYVDTAVSNAVAGVNPAVAVQVATTAAGDTSGLTYLHVAGIGDTFTGSLNTAITIDGHALVLGDRVLIKNDTQTSPGSVSAGTFNGVYLVTTIQSVGVAPVLTRALDYDTPSDINNTGAIPVVLGTANASTSWVLTSSITAVGTGSNTLTYTQFTIAPSTIVTASSTNTFTNKTYDTAGSGNVFKINGTGISAISGSGAVVLVTGATLVTPTLGVASATSINKMAITAPATSSTLAVADGKTATFSNSVTFAGTDSTTMTFPSTTATIARTDAAQTFTGVQTFSCVLQTSNAITASGNAATVPVTANTNTVTNNSAATLTITMTTSGAIDGQKTLVRILDASGVAQTITWVNTENSTSTAPTTSNGSTTLPLTVGFQYNSNTSKWRCIGST